MGKSYNCSCVDCTNAAAIACKKGGFINKRGWTKDEDDRLIKYMQDNGGGDWIHVPKATGIHRTAPSCRGRWYNYLHPGIKHEKFTKEEEDTIIKIHNAVGNRWSFIAKFLPQRSASDVRNYWRFVIMKKFFNGEIDRNMINPNMPIVRDPIISIAVVLRSGDFNKPAGSGTSQTDQMNYIDITQGVGNYNPAELNLELSLSPPGHHGN